MSKKKDITFPGFHDVQNAAEFLGVNAGTIRRWAYTRQLQGIKIGKRGDWRFTKEDLLKMITVNNGNHHAELLVSRENKKNTQYHNTDGEMNHVSSMLAPRLDWKEMNEVEHFVQFYESDAFLLESLSKFISIGLSEGDFCIFFATQEHRKMLEEGLNSYGLDLIDAQLKGKYLAVDASGTLAKLMRDGMPKTEYFFAILENILKRASENKQKVRIYGEMVALLWAEGNQMATIELEKLWNDLGKSHLFSLYCAYPLEVFNREYHSKSFREIGISHSRVIPAESYNALEDTDERLRAISQLQQKAASLEVEIKERKRLEEQKDEFISMASHELKTPVTSLTAYAQVLEKRLRKKGDIQEADYLKRMDAQLEKLTKLIRDLLDVEKMQAGKMVLTKELFRIDPLITEIVEHVQITSPTHMITILNTSGMHVYGDKDRIGQIIINLLTNAIKYSPKAENVQVFITNDNNTIKISVRDFGIGIKEQDQRKIFDRFYQAPDIQEKTYPGLGIGLYISQQIASRHDGKICVESSKGKGSIFSLNLPIATIKVNSTY